MANINGLNTQGTSTWRKEKIQLSPNELHEHVFINTSPNTYYIQNSGDNAILLGIEEIPTVNSFEWKCNKNSDTTFGRPFGTSKLYIFNSGGTQINITLWSYYDENFDVSLNKNTLINIDSAEVTTDGIIKGFQTGVSLPSGTNSLGKIEMGTLFEGFLTGFKTSIETLINTSNSKLQSIITLLSGTLNVIKSDKYITNMYSDVLTDSTGITINSTLIGFSPNKINSIINDGLTIMTATINFNTDKNVEIVLKYGESIQELQMQISSIVLSPQTENETIKCRYIVSNN